MEYIEIKTTKKDEVIDITDTVSEHNFIDEGACVVTVLHTTCAITTADLDPGTDLDTLEALRKFLPKDIKYRHPHDPLHTEDHILSAIIGPSVTIPIQNRNLILGTWQRIVLLEFDGPKNRRVHLTFLSS